MAATLRAVSCLLAAAAAVAPASPVLGQEVLERGEPRVYQGEHLQGVGMPVGGIGTGNIWIAGDGSLSVWQIFNNLTEAARVPHSFFAVRARAEGQAPVACCLEGAARPGFTPLAAASFRGDYPFAWIEFEQGPLPIEVSLQAFNPMIPLDLESSSLPCAIYTLTARNPGERAVEVSFAAALQNAVGYDGFGAIDGNRFFGYGGNQNTLERGPGFARFLLDVPDRNGGRMSRPIALLCNDPPGRAFSVCSGLRTVRLPARGKAPPFDAVSIDPLAAETDRRLLEAAAAVARDGGAAVVRPAGETLAAMIRQEAAAGSPGAGPRWEVFEDFESGSYAGWRIEGEAFGRRPHKGASPDQQPVDGYLGQGLVNTFLPDDRPQGRLVSRPFVIERPYIGFLVGGGGHKGATCVNLEAGGRVVRTAAGANDEYLEPVEWEVADLVGLEAVIEIVDRASGAWGHINVDQIVFSDAPPAVRLGKEEALALLLPALAEGLKELDGPGDSGAASAAVELGAGQLIVLRDALPPQQKLALIAEALGVEYDQGAGLPEEAAAFGDMCLAALDVGATACADFADDAALAADLLDDGRLAGPAACEPSPPGETRNCALAVPFVLEPGEARSAVFVAAWRFPNGERFGHSGNLYACAFESAAAVADHVRLHLGDLEGLTRLYHDTLYETNIPYFALDCISSQTCIFRTVLCFFAARHAATRAPYFAGWEGCYGCCPLNCTHVWNYAQGHARLFPELGRNLRWYDFVHYLKADGETQHRQHAPHGAFIDGHCAVIEGAYREHLTSPDGSFLEEIWPGVRKAVVWLIAAIDADEDGVNAGHQWNTYDVATSGAHTFIGSQYLSALAAAEKMARAVGDGAFAERCARIRAAGSANQDRLLWNGEYYIQIPDPVPARDYNSGCHSDQLLGQWWAHMLDLDYLYPREHVQAALRSIDRYNVRHGFAGFVQAPRRYVVDEEGGLLMCTWPHGGRPHPFILYADEVWTGIEYSTAALMMYEGLLEEAMTIVKTARDRYDGRVRAGLDSGPGGNPFCELECGRFYARALSSWSLLLAAQGFIYDGPASRIGFVPRWRPDDHRSFFTAAEGWGLFRQTIAGDCLQAAVEVRFGRVPVREIVLGRFGRTAENPAVEVRINGRPLPAAQAAVRGDRIVIALPDELAVNARDVLTVAVKG